MRLWRWLRRLPGWLSGANRRRPYRSATDVYLEQRDERLAGLAQRVAAVEEQVERMRSLPEARRRRDAGHH